MKLSKNPSLSELYKYSREKKKDLIKNKDYLPIIVASTLSAATSLVLTKYDFIKKPFTGNLAIDILLGAFSITLIFFSLILVSLKLIKFIDRIFLFLGLVYKKWRPFSKFKNFKRKIYIVFMTINL